MLNNNFSIITACIRPQNLPLLYKSILQSKQGLDINIKWYIVMEARKREAVLPDISWQNPNCPIQITTRIGEPKSSPVNTALELVTQDSVKSWVLWLDDDNIMHPDYFKRFYDSQCPFPSIVIYYQQLTKVLAAVNPLVRLTSTCNPGSIDTGQFTVASNLIGKIIWDRNNETKAADGHFIKEVFYWNNDKLRRLDHIMAYYNYLA